MEKEVLTVPEAADYLRLQPTVLRGMLGNGEIPGTKVGREWRIRKEDLRKYLSNGRDLKVYIFKSEDQEPLVVCIEDWDEKFDNRLKRARMEWKRLEGEPLEEEIRENLPDYQISFLPYIEIGI